MLGADPPREQSASGADPRKSKQREILDLVCLRLGVTPLRLLAQPLDETKRQILSVRPDLARMPDPWRDLIPALKEYATHVPS